MLWLRYMLIVTHFLVGVRQNRMECEWSECVKQKAFQVVNRLEKHCEWSTLSILPVNMLSLKYNVLFELFSKETQGSELSPPAQDQLKYETRTWRVALIPEIVAAVLKVNEHQLLFVRSLATLQQQDVSCKTSKQNDHGMKKTIRYQLIEASYLDLDSNY